MTTEGPLGGWQRPVQGPFGTARRALRTAGRALRTPPDGPLRAPKGPFQPPLLLSHGPSKGASAQLRGPFLQKKGHLRQPQQRLQPRLPDIGSAGFSAEPSGAELCRITGYVMHSNLHLEAPRWTTFRKNVRVSCMYMLHMSCSLLQTRVELCFRLDAVWLRCRRRAGQPLRCIRAMRSSASHDQRL